MQQIIIKHDILSIYFEETKSHVQIPSWELNKLIEKQAIKAEGSISAKLYNEL